MGFSINLPDTTGKKGDFCFCRCGCVQNKSGNIDKSVFNEEYRTRYQNIKGIVSREEYILKTFLPIVEESTYGRKFLDVGFTHPYKIDYLRNRGWITDGIDLMPNDYIVGDYEKYNFGNKKYDFIWLGNILQSFDSPGGMLIKTHELLNLGGLAFISTPFTELMYSVGLKNWGNWNLSENNIYFSKSKLTEVLKTIGFDIIVMRENYSSRFTAWNNLHIVVQKGTDYNAVAVEDING